MSFRGVISSELLQQLQRQIKALTVEKLKKILRNAGLTVTGTKAILVERIATGIFVNFKRPIATSFPNDDTELNHLSQTHDMAKFTRLRQLIQNPENPQSPMPSLSPVYSQSGSFNVSNFVASHVNGTATNAYTSNSGRSGSDVSTSLNFKPSPFFTGHDMIGVHRQLEIREQSRDIMEFSFRIRNDVLERLRRDRSLKVLLYSGTDDALRFPADITFPSHFDLKINGSEIRANYKGLKNKTGTTRPVDVTGLLSQSATQENHVWLTWAVTSRRYHLAFYLVRQHDPHELLQKLKSAKRISRSSVINEMNTWAGDSDIVATSSKMSLKCPLSTMRIETPCRSRICRHNQCFDALSFLQLQEQAPQWNCPVCNRSVPFEILQVDEYVEDILKSTSRSAEQVTVEPDGRWFSVKEELDSAVTTKQPKEEDSENSDDIEIIDSSPNEQERQSSYTATAQVRIDRLTSRDRASTIHTPTSASKRSASEVIDLTADTDDEDDQPVLPPPKRQMTSSTSNYEWGQTPYRPSLSSMEYSNRHSFSPMSKHSQFSSSHRTGR